MDGAAFEHEALGAVALAALDLEDLARHLVVTLPWPVQAAIEATPGVEGPVHAAYFAAGIGHEGRPGVAHPGVVGGDLHQADTLVVQARTGIFVLRRADADGHRLELGDGLGHGAEGGLRRLAAVAPVVRALGPDHPGLAVGFPFRRHAEAIGARSAAQGRHISPVARRRSGMSVVAPLTANGARHRWAYSQRLAPSSVESGQYRFGRRSRNTPQAVRIFSSSSRSKLCTRTPSSLRSSSSTFSPYGLAMNELP